MEKIDVTKTVESYLHNEDWRVKENASATFNLSGLIRYNSGAIVSRYWLNDVYTEEIAQAHRNCYIHLHDLSLFAPYCFTGDTRIATLDGKNRSFEELVQANVKELWVYAYDRKNNRVVPALAINPRVTREVSELVKVTLNNGKTVTSTSDHLYMTRDGEYIEAKNLVKGMSLMPLYVESLGKYVGINPDWYSGKRGYVHRWVMENILGRRLAENEVVHHKNGDKHDNRPSNLEVMDDAEHRAMEINKTMLTQVWKDNNALRLAQYNKSEAKRRSVSDFANTRKRDEKGRFTDFAFDETLNETSEVYNHKVRKVEFIELDEPIKVYDLTVPEFENFALDAGVFVHNCAGWSLRQLLTEGFGGVEGKTNSAPAKHLHTAVNHIVNFLGVLQLEWAGAQAFSSLDTYLAPFIKIDNMDYKAVKQCVQSLVFGLNISSRWGEPPFSNFTIDWTCPEDMKYLPAIVGGKEQDFTYGECQKEMDMFNKALMEVMIEGDANGRGHIYPVLTYSITKDFDWSETENNKLLFEMSAKYGIPYFSNYVNSDMDASDVRSMCPLTGDTKVLIKGGKGILVRTIKDLYDTEKRTGCSYQVWDGTSWCDATLNRQIDQRVFKITMSNNDFVKMGEFHRQPVVRDGQFMIIPAKEVRVGDKIPYNMNYVETPAVGSYNIGYVVGAYCGDGSHDSGRAIFSFDTLGRKDDVAKKIVDTLMYDLGFKVSVHQNEEKHVCNYSFSTGSYSFIERYVSGDSALEKRLTAEIYNSSTDFLEGFIDGLADTDGSRDKRRIYTVSRDLAEQIVEVCNLLGMKAYIQNTDTREGRLGNNPVYCIAYPKRVRFGKKYDGDDRFDYWYVTDIEEVKSESLYCMEVDNEEMIFMLANGMITGNCRLRLDLRELRRKNGGFFGSGESTGSIGVVTLNLPRMAYTALNYEDFFAQIEKYMDIARDSLEIKRKVCTEWLERGLYPYTKRYLGTFDNHFSTIGLVGMYEAWLNLKNNAHVKYCEVASYADFAKDVLNFMRYRIQGYQEETGNIYNLESTPAESTAYRFARHDVETLPDIITAGTHEAPFYTNSSNLPVDYTDDVFEMLDVQDGIQTLYTGGTVAHVFLGEKLPNWRACMMLVRKIAEGYHIPYFTISPTYSVCPEHGYIAGEHWTCPDCGKPTEVYSRITGYYRPVKNWNIGKREEFKERTTYTVS